MYQEEYPVPAEEENGREYYFSLSSVVDKLNKRSELYLFRMCVAQCTRSCLLLNYAVSPSTLVSNFTYGPLLLDLLKCAVNDSNIVSEYQEIVTRRVLHLNDIYTDLSNLTISENDGNTPINIQKRMEDILTTYNNINSNIYDAEYLYKNRSNPTIEKIINRIVEYVIRNDHYKQVLIKLIEKHFGCSLHIIKKNYYVNRLLKICKELSLDDICAKILILMYAFYRTVNTTKDVLSHIIQISGKQFDERINKLIDLGLLEPNNNTMSVSLTDIVGSYVCGNYNKSFSQYLLEAYKSDNKIKLNLDDYPEHIQDSIKYMIKMINNHDGKSPCNILLYGKSGSGKSSLIDYLQNTISSKMFCPVTVENIIRYKQNSTFTNSGEVDRPVDAKQTYNEVSANKNSARERLLYLKLCDNLPTHDKFVFVVDECDDSLNNPQSDVNCWLTGKKQLNELLEQMKTPTIWIANHVDTLDESTCRRFSFSIKFDELNFKQRTKIWINQMKYTHTEKYMKYVDVDQLALTYKISAGLINSTLQSIKTINPNIKQVPKIIDDIIKSHCDLIKLDYNYKDNRKSEHSIYSIDGLNVKSKTPLNDITTGLMLFYKQLLNKTNKNRNINLLLDGPPGTGKTEYAKYIARQLDAPLVVCHGSDFLSKYVGETEQKIKKVFTEAEQTKSILFIDEADGLIHQRSGSEHSWEVSQVNEFLCNMERFNGILICATNFIKNMDDASIRRFSFKVTFDYLDDAGKLLFFKRFFETFGEFDYDYVERKLVNIQNLVPGDFKIVRDRCTFLYNGCVDCETILQQLVDETTYKGGVINRKQIGF